MQFTYADVNRSKFVDELQAAGIDFNNVAINGLDDSNIGVIVTILNSDDTVKVVVDNVYTTHDPTPIPPPLSETEKIRLEMARSNAEMFEMMVSMMGGGM